MVTALVPSIALVLAGLQPATESPTPVPVQRPTAVGGNTQPVPDAEPPQAEPPTAEPPDIEQPAPDPGAADPPVDEQPETDVENDVATVEALSMKPGRIDGRLTDGEAAGVPRPGVMVHLQCSCLTETFTTATNDDGRFAVEGLPPGIYTVTANQGGGPSEEMISLSPGEETWVELVLAPPIPTAEIDALHEKRSRAQSMIAGGGVLGVTALLLMIGSLVEGAKRDCLFGQETCEAAPRPAVTRGLGISAGVLAAGGATLIGIGVHRLRKLRPSVSLGDDSVAFTLSGRF
ncbi:MAG: carboxypeptidase regulatory-like domain-containing protein [Deltaproteobacteria bacterium]|nr:carboxypeptidase regulatory-like domain-containing protein [Deltaproteobacteria bacterium]